MLVPVSRFTTFVPGGSGGGVVDAAVVALFLQLEEQHNKIVINETSRALGYVVFMTIKVNVPPGGRKSPNGYPAGYPSCRLPVLARLPVLPFHNRFHLILHLHFLVNILDMFLDGVGGDKQFGGYFLNQLAL